MRTYDVKKTEDFFNTSFSDSQKTYIDANPSERLHPRDRILLQRLLGTVIPPDGRIVDYACGHGRLLLEMLDQGYDCIGVEKHPGMRKVAVDALMKHGKSADRVLLGSLDVLRTMPDYSVDIFIAMGLFQYLSDIEFEQVLEQAARLLRPGGHLVATFQNAFFDIYTFNKYTVDFLMNDLLAELIPQHNRAQAQHLIEGLMTNPDKPPYSDDRARDNIFVRLSNPLAIPETLARHRLSHRKTYFYEYFGLPPLLTGKAPEIARAISAKLEVIDAESWRGMFMANAFLCHAVRN